MVVVLIELIQWSKAIKKVGGKFPAFLFIHYLISKESGQ